MPRDKGSLRINEILLKLDPERGLNELVMIDYKKQRDEMEKW